MKCYDFEYDSVRLSDLGFVICQFDSSDVETVSNGSEIKFETVSTLNGIKHELTSAIYEDCLTATFQICKHPCDYDETEVSVEDMRKIMRWLNRKEYHKFKLLDDEYSSIYLEASFNVSKVEIDGRIRGFELEMFTNRPFALQEPVLIALDIVEANEAKTIYSVSDEEGYIYPNMEITISASGVLEIYNASEDRTMRINNCKKGEVITVEYPMISSSLPSHKIQNDFNWQFFRISSTFKDKENNVTVSLPCSIKMEYSPIAKIGI